MFDAITLYFADKYLMLDMKSKRNKLFRLERIKEFLEKIFRYAIGISIILCMPWNIHEIMQGNYFYGFADIVIECGLYPIIIWYECKMLWENKLNVSLILLITNIAICIHTPTYSLMLVWSLCVMAVQFMKSGLIELPGYPQFREEVKEHKNAQEDMKDFSAELESKGNYRFLQYQPVSDNTSDEITAQEIAEAMSREDT